MPGICGCQAKKLENVQILITTDQGKWSRCGMNCNATGQLQCLWKLYRRCKHCILYIAGVNCHNITAATVMRGGRALRSSIPALNVNQES